MIYFFIIGLCAGTLLGYAYGIGKHDRDTNRRIKHYIKQLPKAF
jgi:hypothetical protein